MNNIALIFPGQGSQYIGMGKSLCEDSKVAKDTFDEANNILDFDLQKVCFEGSIGELNKIENMLLAILTTSVAAFRTLMSEVDINPNYLAGHSLGEYSALVCSGALSFADALKIVRLRSNLAKEVAESLKGSMTIIEDAQLSLLEEECKRVSKSGNIAMISCYNSHNQYAISGNQEAVMKVEDRMLEAGAKITPLIMGAPFHSSLMEKAADKLHGELIKYKLNEFKWPVISNVYALPYENKNAIAQNLSLQIMKPVQWNDIINYMVLHNVTTILEVGPQSVLKSLIKSGVYNITTLSYNQKSDKKILLEAALKSNDNKGNKPILPSVVTRCLAMSVTTRNRNWDNDEYSEGVTKPYIRIKEIQEKLDKEGTEASIEDMKECLDLLYTIFNTKKLPINEQISRFNKIFNQTGTEHLFNDFIERRYLCVKQNS